MRGITGAVLAGIGALASQQAAAQSVRDFYSGSGNQMRIIIRTTVGGDYDIISFTGYGDWSKDSDVHTVNVQVSEAPGEPYVRIQIDGGTISKVHTKPRVAPIP